MKFLLVLLMTALTSTSFAQVAQVNPFETAAEVAVCFIVGGTDGIALAIDASGSVSGAYGVAMDQASGGIAPTSELVVSSFSKDDSNMSLVGELTTIGVSIDVKVARAAVDLTYNDEANVSVSIPTYDGTVSITEGTVVTEVKFQCTVEAQ